MAAGPMAERLGIECNICLEAFSTTLDEKMPRLLSCGHSFCTGCLCRLAGKDTEGVVCCAACMTNTFLPGLDNDVHLLCKNFTVLDILHKVEGVSEEQMGLPFQGIPAAATGEATRIPQQGGTPGQQPTQLVTWTGSLEWHDRPWMVSNDQKLIHSINCHILAAPDANLTTDSWPKQLIVQIIPHKFLQQLGSLIKNNKTVFFQFPDKDNDMVSYRALMKSTQKPFPLQPDRRQPKPNPSRLSSRSNKQRPTPLPRRPPALPVSLPLQQLSSSKPSHSCNNQESGCTARNR